MSSGPREDLTRHMLCRILFGGFGGGGGHSRNVTPEERERFRQRMPERFCRASGENQES